MYLFFVYTYSECVYMYIYIYTYHICVYEAVFTMCLVIKVGLLIGISKPPILTPNQCLTKTQIIISYHDAMLSKECSAACRRSEEGVP